MPQEPPEIKPAPPEPLEIQPKAEPAPSGELGPEPQELAPTAPLPKPAAPLGKFREWNLDDGLAIYGFDVVSYFNEPEPLKGKKKFAVEYRGAEFRFRTELNKKLFQREPERYLPQFGSWCALAMAHGKFIGADPKKYSVYQDKLYLFQRGAKKHFDGHEAGLAPRAERIWERHLEETLHAAERRPPEQYYDELEAKCRKRPGIDCCYASVERMEKGGYRETPGPSLRYSGCPVGTEPITLKCKDSLRWCVPTAEKEAE